jgi:hypothetical protein
LVLLALVGSPAAFAQAPSLTGERLDGSASPSLGIGEVALECNPTGTSTGSYMVVGTAIGPFPGTFVETASFTIVGGQVTAFEADFTISSGLTQIDGTKTLRTSTSATCLDAPGDGLADFADIALVADYEAMITTPLGMSMDQGRVSSGAQLQTTLDGRASAATQESFISETVAPAPTAGHATGGGYVGDVVNQWVSFGFTAKSDGATVKGQCSVSDHVRGVQVKCLDVTLLTQTATHASFEGHALVDGMPTTYRVDVDDLGEPGAGSDRFEIETASGFSVTGVLAGGNIQIRD